MDINPIVRKVPASTVPNKSRKRAAVITLQGFSILAGLVVVVGFLRGQGWAVWPETMDENIIQYALVPITGIVHAGVKWLAHKLDVEIVIPGLTTSSAEHAAARRVPR